MEFVLSQFLFLFFGLIGLLVWASSDIPMAVREIAINTRKDPSRGSSYVLIKVFSVCMKVFAVLLWIISLVAILAISIGGATLSELFQVPPGM